jgi:hypothetical protein
MTQASMTQHSRRVHKTDSNFQLIIRNVQLIDLWGRDSSVSIATLYGLTVRGSKPDGGEIFRTRPDCSWGPPCLLLKTVPCQSPGVKRPDLGVNHPPQYSAEVQEREKLYLYSRCVLSWPVLGWNLHLSNYLHAGKEMTSNIYTTNSFVPCDLIHWQL